VNLFSAQIVDFLLTAKNGRKPFPAYFSKDRIILPFYTLVVDSLFQPEKSATLEKLLTKFSSCVYKHRGNTHGDLHGPEKIECLIHYIGVFMFGIGMPELLVIAVVALLVVGPKKLPDIAKALGKGLSEFRKATDGAAETIKETLKADDLKKDMETIKDSILHGEKEEPKAAVSDNAALDAQNNTSSGTEHKPHV